MHYLQFSLTNTENSTQQKTYIIISPRGNNYINQKTPITRTFLIQQMKMENDPRRKKIESFEIRGK